MGRTRIRPTAFGVRAIVFYAVVSLAYFASPYTNLFFMLFAFLTVVFTLNAVWTTASVRGLSGRVADITPIPADSIAECEVQVDPFHRPRLHVEVQVRFDRGRRHLVRHVHVLEEGGRLKGHLPGLPRGVHEITAFDITSTYPLGLLRAVQRLECQSTLTVYPKPLTERILDQSGLAAAGREITVQNANAGGGQDSETAALREFREGDSMRNVHWRASARNPRNLIVREYEATADRAIEVQLDARCDGDEQFELALSAVARLVLTGQETDEPVVFRSQDLDDTFGAGRRPLEELWRWLAIAAPLPQSAPEPPPTKTADAVRLPAALERLAEVAP